MKQIFYIEDLVDPTWHVVFSTTTHEETNDRPFEDSSNNIVLLQSPFASQIPNLDNNVDYDNCDNICVQSDRKGI